MDPSFLSRSSRFVVFLTAAVVLSGCTRAPSLVFSDGAALRDSELPKQHVTQIRAGLAKIFGTPDHPVLLVPEDGAASSTDETNTADAGESAASEPEGRSDEAQKEQEDKLVDAADRLVLQQGSRVYQARCSGCHGTTGDGQGTAAPFLLPKPRNYQLGLFKFTSTPYGIKPARQDLVRIIRRGARGTSMPAFAWMPDDDLNAVIEYVIYLSLRGEVERSVTEIALQDYEEEDEIPLLDFVESLAAARESWKLAESQVVLAASAEPANDEASIRRGRELFIQENCYKCHGADAKGQTAWLSRAFLQQQAALPEEQRSQINYDAWGQPAPAADITSRLLHGGRRNIDIYRRVHTGITGTPMPAFGDLFQAHPENMWHLVHYVLHIVEGGDPVLGIQPPPDAPEKSG